MMPLGRRASPFPLTRLMSRFDKGPGKTDDQEIGPVDRLVAGQKQMRDPPRELAPHKDGQQHHRCSPCHPISVGSC